MFGKVARSNVSSLCPIDSRASRSCRSGFHGERDHGSLLELRYPAGDVILTNALPGDSIVKVSQLFRTNLTS